jgi:xyloglucan 6-xylosyltransferase
MLSVPIILQVALFLVAPCAFIFFMSPDLSLPRIRIEYGRRDSGVVPPGAPTVEPTPPITPPPPAEVVDGDQ